MKAKILLAALIAFSLLSCNNESSQVAADETEFNAEQTEVQGTDAASLTLNNGKKWQADENTNMHASNMNALVENFRAQTNNDDETYQVFAADLQNELAYLVRDCRMKGPDHDALHLWLEPVMADAKALEKAATAAEGKPIAEKLSINISKFNEYFEYAH